MSVAYVIGFLVLFIVFCRYKELSILDLLNACVRAGKCKPFHAGVDALPDSTILFPELFKLEANFEEISKEILEAVDMHSLPSMQETYNRIFCGAAGKEPRNRWYHPLATQLWRLAFGKHMDTFNEIHSNGWKTLTLKFMSHMIIENAILCPLLFAHLVDLDCVESALISVMYPYTNIPLHVDPEASTVLRYHLAIQTPENTKECFMTVDGKRYEWKCGKSVIFDSLYEHAVTNNTQQRRVVLFLDLKRPLYGFTRTLQSITEVINKYSPGTQSVLNFADIHCTPDSPFIKP